MTLKRIYFRNDEEAEKCYGKHVVIKDFHNRNVILDENKEPITGDDFDEVFEKAQKMGYKMPVAIRDPEPA